MKYVTITFVQWVKDAKDRNQIYENRTWICERKYRYRVCRRKGCLLRCLCFKAEENRTIDLNHRLRKYKQKARELLCSGEELKHWGQRCIKPETMFGLYLLRVLPVTRIATIVT